MPDINEKKFWDEFERIAGKQGAMAMEALMDIFHRIPFGEEITFANGKKGKIEVFTKPKINTERNDHLGNTPYAGIDVTFDDGHLEFIMYYSGFGGDAEDVHSSSLEEDDVGGRQESDKN